jgi:hypothetical protein
MSTQAMSQELPFRQIPDYPESMNEATVLARFVEGLGYRYYWATEGLREQDLSFKPSPDARSTRETIEHLYGLARFTLYTVRGDTIIFDQEYESNTFQDLRKQTLNMLAEASTLLRSENYEATSITFPKASDGSGRSLPYWHLMNGPVSDALYHTGQVVSFRRSSGNPMNPNVNVFLGKTAE